MGVYRRKMEHGSLSGEIKPDLPSWMKGKGHTYAKIYCFLTAWFLAALVFTLIYSHSANIGSYFITDWLDTGMDFFNSVENTKGGHPYTQFQTLYPPLANLFFWIVQECVPRELTDSWPDSLAGAVAMRGTAFDLRVFQVTAFAFILFAAVAACLMVSVSSYCFENARKGMVFGLALLFSYGSMFAFERGNIILYAYLFLMIFLLFYNSNQKWLRELAYLSLAVSAGIKLYPAVFGALLLYQKKWKDALRLICYGCAAVFLPFIKFDGLRGAVICFQTVAGFADTAAAAANPVSPYAVDGYSAENLLKSIYFQISCIFPADYERLADGMHGYAGIIKWLLIAVLAAGTVILKEEWKKLLAFGMIILFIHKSAGYTLLFVLPSLVMLCRENRVTRSNNIYFLLLCVMHLPLPVMIQLGVHEISLIRILHCNAVTAAAVLLTADTVRTARQNQFFHIRRKARA